MARTWIVLADSSRARILEASSATSDLAEVATIEHPQSRAHERDLTTDAPGTRFATAGHGRHGGGPATSAKDEQAVLFARELAERLDRDLMDGRYHRLIVAAAPKFLGLLREELTTLTTSVMALEYPKNWVHDDARTIRERLPTFI